MDGSYLSALAGGILIGIAATLLLVSIGRVMGVSGIIGRLNRAPDKGWRLSFLGGMAVGGIVYLIFAPSPFVSSERPISWLLASGLLVGFGTRLGNGCTSGHGVCGISRLSLRSIIATLTFIGAGMLTVWLVRELGQ